MRAPLFRTGPAALAVVSALAGAVVASAPGHAWAQSPSQAGAQGGSRAGFQVGGTLQRYTFDEPSATGIDVLELRTLDFGGRWRLGRTDLTVTGAWAQGVLEAADGERATISGLTDTQVTLGLTTGQGLSFAAIGLLPTGLASQTLDESRVAGAMGADLFPFAVTNWGTGGGGGGLVSFARRTGGVGLGVSVSYIVRASFEPLDVAEFAYRPGNVLTVVAAVDGNPTPSTKASLRAAYHRHAEDQVEGTNLYRPGDRFEGTASLAFPVGGGSSGIVYGSFHNRAGGRFLDFDEQASQQDLVRIGGGLRVPYGGTVLQPDLQARFFRRDDGREQGYHFGGGLDVEVPTERLILVPGVRVYLGNVELSETAKSSFTGLEVSLAARFGGRR